MSRDRGRLALWASLVIFLIFFLNVALGAMGASVFLTDVGEAVVLFVAVIFFVVAILISEARAKAAGKQ